MYKLVIEDDDGNKTVVPVIRDEISIGRQDGNTIRLTERNVSRKHARLIKEANAVFIEELNARYGLKKNGEKVAGKQPFTVGDVYLIGDYRLTLLAEGAEAEAASNGSAPPPKLNGAPPPAAAQAPKGTGFTSAPTQITRREDIERGRSQGTEIIAAQPAKIVVVSSNFAGQEFPLANKEMVIGRAEDCDIIVDHRSVSQKHAKIVREAAGTYKIVDLNSKNGVKVSGEDYRAVHLKRGDIIELGHVKFRFVEPGENYVFTPQAIIEDSFPAAESGPNMKLIGGGIAVFAILAIVAGVAVLNGSKTKDPAPDETPEVAANDPKPTTTAAQATNNSSSVQPQIALAKEKLDSGAAGTAIAFLELARDTMNPSAEERTQIDEMLSQARREKPLEEALEDGRKYFRDGRFVAALQELKKIPPGDSISRGIMEKEGLADKVIDQVISQASAALQEGEKAQAAQLAEEVLLYDASNKDAADIKTKAETKEKVAVAKPAPKNNDKPKKPAPSAEDAADREAEGRAKIVSGDASGAIKACWGVNTAGCHRIVGTAYKNLGEIEKSCASFKKAGMNPPHCQ
ncbi:MAG: FHA domain-containing protein [bacterium]